MLLTGIDIAMDIKRRCREAGVSVKAVCLEAKVAYRTYCSWQQGENDPSFAMLRRIYAAIERFRRAE